MISNEILEKEFDKLMYKQEILKNFKQEQEILKLQKRIKALKEKNRFTISIKISNFILSFKRK